MTDGRTDGLLQRVTLAFPWPNYRLVLPRFVFDLQETC